MPGALPQPSSRVDVEADDRFAWAVRLFATWVPALVVIILGLADPRLPSSALPDLITATAFSQHGTPEILASDALATARRYPEIANEALSLANTLGEQSPAVTARIRQTASGSYYSDRFWLYALLAVPFLTLGAIGSASAAFGFVCVNVGAVLVAYAYLGRAFATPRQRLQARWLFLGCGTCFYLGWADPAVPVAAAVLIATLAATRAELGIGLVAAGFAASLTPSAIVIVVFVIAWWLRLRWWPDTSISGPPTKPRLQWRDAGGALLGLGLAALPYWFFRAKFGVSHPGVPDTHDFRLVEAGRFQSFFFDWNQGMVVGVPGVMFALSIATYAALFGSARSERRELVSGLFFTDLAVTFFMLPALALRDFNDESSVFLRAAYVRAMPLLGCLFALLPRLPLRFERPIVIACATAQLAVIAWHGPTGADSNHLRFTPLAELALTHFPALYDPDPEIFRERTLGRESPRESRRARQAAEPLAWPLTGRPQKILAPASGPVHLPRLCGPRRSVTSPSVTRISAHERYLDAPFRCSAE